MRISSLPDGQKFSCHSCTHCCRTYIVTVTEEERERLLRQGWEGKLDLSADKLFQRIDVGGGRMRWRLGHDESGACVFLSGDGLCRIHAEFGEQAKPIECQIYPFTFVRADNRVRVNLRFACPSVADNRGRSVKEQQRALEHLAQRYLADAAKPSSPVLRQGVELTWEQCDTIAQTFINALTDESLDLTARAVCASQLLEVLRHLPSHPTSPAREEESSSPPARGERKGGSVTVSLNALSHYYTRLAEGIKSEGYQRMKPSHATLVLFRLTAAIYARKENGTSGWSNLMSALSFIAGKGETPRLQPHLPAARFEDLERPLTALSDESVELLTRYYRVKLSSLCFFGSAHFGCTVIEGLGALLLTYPLILYFARWFAAGEENISHRAMSQAVQLVDAAYGYRRALGLAAQRKRVNLLAQEARLSRLMTWYGATPE